MLTSRVRIIDGCITKDFKEEEHPRGGSDNPGQFVKKGEGSKKPTIESNLTQTKRDGKTLTLSNGQTLPDHIKKIPIPPAWTNVHINPDPKGKVQVTGIDSKGRKQVKYSLEHDEKQSIIKFKRIKNLSEDIYNINKAINGAEDKETALCLKLIEQTGCRADTGADTLAKTKAYGATSITDEHIFPEEDKVILKFIGKKGKENIYTVTDKQLVKELTERKNKKGKVFDTDYNKLKSFTSKITNNKYTPKDFRTKIACDQAKFLIEKLPKPTTEKQYKKQVLSVGQYVSEKLNNTRSICLDKYINPNLFSQWVIKGE